MKYSSAPKAEKCNFLIGTIDYLGHGLRPRLLKIEAHMTNTIKRLGQPTKIIEHRWCLGLCKVFRCFVSIFAHIAAPHNQNKKNQPPHFGASSVGELKAIHEKQANCCHYRYSHYQTLGPRYNLETDACNFQIGFVLLQEKPNGITKPVKYCSPSLTTTKQAYDTT